ncbi:hypothetical protein H3147_15830 [Streptomyces sp. OF8]|uniref:Methyltransferase domain-containing protein n=1 Tax=Streptomyces alkaliterrae TaxID=2213162 RepID=A0A5P0YNZ7_9ACTN|nr:hypothetical protein [Streptomyces alkaliterrae]MQS02001.1 hypothetical protein [Streptomyces alkaliterrae]
MLDVVVVVHARDAVTDFLSVLEETRDRETTVLTVAADGACRAVRLPARGTTAERIGALTAARTERPHTHAAGGPPPAPAASLADALALIAAGGRPLRVWTHSPADDRPDRRALGLAVARLAPGEVRHAVGAAAHLQFLAEETRPLDARLVAAKLDFVNRHHAALLHDDPLAPSLDTARLPSVERFFRADRRQSDRLYALMSSLGEDAAEVADPWEFETSGYEAERLDATTAWISRVCPPGAEPLVELGACEGALTRRLVDKGYSVVATEPNAVFRERLARGVDRDRVTVTADDLAALARAPRRAGGAHLLVEILYYGQPLELLDRLPGGPLFVALAPERVCDLLRPWLGRSAAWAAEEELTLVAPRVEPVCGGRAYLRKRGSVGLLLRRRDG